MDNQNERLLEYIVTAYNLGLSIIPLNRQSKLPTVKWKQYQIDRPTKQQLREWFLKGQYNYGIITGAISSIVVVDTDSPQAEEWVRKNIPITPVKTQTHKGTHHFYKHPGFKIKNIAKTFIYGEKVDIDIRGDGGYVVGPGSIHESGFIYKSLGVWNFDLIPTYDPNWFPIQRGFENGL